jgi:hypothetical protein
MTRSGSEIKKEIEAQFERLGLRPDTMPGGGLMLAGGGLEDFIQVLKRLEPGVTWRDIFPDLPAHWEVGKPETWTTPYRPLGPYDYQELPTGPAVHITWSDKVPEPLDTIVAAARKAGWPVFGAGVITGPAPHRRTDAMIVLKRGTTEEQLQAFAAWIDTQSGFAVATIPRLGTERYMEPGKAAT